MFGPSVSFGEVKCCSESDNNYAICKDLVCIGIFSKESLDVNNMKGVLSYQIVGTLYIKIYACIVNLNFYI